MALRVEIRLCVKDSETALFIHVDELIRRLLAYFPNAVVDRDRGNAFVQQGLDDLIARGTPSVILDSHRTYFDNVVFVEIVETRWNGAKVASYLSSMYPQLGDGAHFEVSGEFNGGTLEAIVSELEAALGLVACPKFRSDTGSA